MNTLVVVWGGADTKFLNKLDVSNLYFEDFYDLELDLINKTEPDEFVACLLTGEDKDIHGISGSMHYQNKVLNQIESRLSNHYIFKKTKGLRKGFYHAFNRIDSKKRRYIQKDYNIASIASKDSFSSVCLPSINPEPQWCVYRNTIRQDEFTGLGEKEALQLIQKNFEWRKKKLKETLNEGNDLIMAHFQYIDSHQHLFYENKEYKDLDKVKEAYRELDDYAGKLIDKAEEESYKVIFMSEYGVPTPEGNNTHASAAYYSTNLDWSGDLKITQMNSKIEELA